MSLSGSRFEKQIADVAAARRALKEHEEQSTARRRQLTAEYAQTLEAASAAGMPRRELAALFSTTAAAMTQVVHRHRRERGAGSVVVSLDAVKRSRR